MKKFRFRFETVLDVRRKREQDALVALGSAQRAYQHEVANKVNLQRDLQLSLERRESLGRQSTPIQTFLTEQDFITGTKQRLIKADHAILRASRVVEKALRAYLNARKQTRMIEALEEKDRREFRLEQSRKEQKLMDEMVIMRSRLREQEESA
jgi:flagellar FliJ protein